MEPQLLTQEVHELKNEWEQFKTRALWVLIGGIVAMVSYGVWVGNIQTRISNNEDSIQDNSAAIQRLTETVNTTNITMASVLAKLGSIESTLIEIKASLKR